MVERVPERMLELILASSSPRRQQFMADLGVPFTVDASDVDETPHNREHPLDYVKRVTKDKALTVAQRHAGKVILAADTTVTVGQRILGKPENAADAEKMLRLCSGKRQQVITAVSVVDAEGKHHQKIETVVVKFKMLTEKDIERHVANAENWQGKAGAWGIQSTAGCALTKWMRGQYSAVVGLPLVETINLLRKAHIDV